MINIIKYYLHLNDVFKMGKKCTLVQWIIDKLKIFTSQNKFCYLA